MGYHERRRCSRDTYPESYTTLYTSIQRSTERKPKRARHCCASSVSMSSWSSHSR